MVKKAEEIGTEDLLCIGELKRSQLRRQELVAVTPTHSMDPFLYARTRVIRDDRAKEAQRRIKKRR